MYATFLTSIHVYINMFVNKINNNKTARTEHWARWTVRISCGSWSSFKMEICVASSIIFTACLRSNLLVIAVQDGDIYMRSILYYFTACLRSNLLVIVRDGDVRSILYYFTAYLRSNLFLSASIFLSIFHWQPFSLIIVTCSARANYSRWRTLLCLLVIRSV